MKKEDYQALRELLKEFREEAAELKARIEEHDGRVKEAELRLKTIQDSEPEDRKIFSPRRVEVLYKEEIGRIKEEKAVHEEQIQRLCSRREVLERRISRLEAVCRHQREHARSRRDASLMELENIIGRIESSSGYIDRNPIQARQELAIIAKSLREIMDRMRDGGISGP